MSGEGRFSDEWWEHIWIVSAIMQYKIVVEQEESRARELEVDKEIDDIHYHIQNVNRKLDLIMERMGIAEKVSD